MLMQRLLVLSLSFFASLAADGAEPARHWELTQTLPAAEAGQAAAADERFVYAITNTKVAKYDRRSGERLAVSEGAAEHLNSGFLWNGRLYCAHSNYPKTPEQSEIKVLDLASMKLTTFHDFDASEGSLTWALHKDDHWWCHFAFYGDDNLRSYLAQFDREWREVQRWTLPQELIAKLGRFSLSGGVWMGEELLVTGHDDPVVFRLRLPKSDRVLEFISAEAAPFTGQGIAIDLVTNGLVGIHRQRKEVRFAGIR